MVEGPNRYSNRVYFLENQGFDHADDFLHRRRAIRLLPPPALLSDVGSIVLYLGFVQPFVDTARLSCEIKGASSSAQRIEIFEEVLVKGEFFPKTWSDVAIE
ncbi:MAG TPA: hypothetical protein VGH38_13570, partial [Bryobacteraceae bacterium]